MNCRITYVIDAYSNKTVMFSLNKNPNTLIMKISKRNFEKKRNGQSPLFFLTVWSAIEKIQV